MDVTNHHHSGHCEFEMEVLFSHQKQKQKRRETRPPTDFMFRSNNTGSLFNNLGRQGGMNSEYEYANLKTETVKELVMKKKNQRVWMALHILFSL